jgi:hypothetical protein
VLCGGSRALAVLALALFQGRRRRSYFCCRRICQGREVPFAVVATGPVPGRARTAAVRALVALPEAAEQALVLGLGQQRRGRVHLRQRALETCVTKREKCVRECAMRGLREEALGGTWSSTAMRSLTTTGA